MNENCWQDIWKLWQQENPNIKEDVALDIFRQYEERMAAERQLSADETRLPERIDTVERLRAMRGLIIPISELARRIDGLIAFQSQHRDYLIRTGLPPVWFRDCDWLSLHLARLYDTRRTVSPYPTGTFLRQCGSAPESQPDAAQTQPGSTASQDEANEPETQLADGGASRSVQTGGTEPYRGLRVAADPKLRDGEQMPEGTEQPPLASQPLGMYRCLGKKDGNRCVWGYEECEIEEADFLKQFVSPQRVRAFVNGREADPRRAYGVSDTNGTVDPLAARSLS